MRKMFTLTWLVLFVAIVANAADMPQWKKKKIEEMGRGESVKNIAQEPIINATFAWMPAYYVPDFEHYNFRTLESANDNVVWIAGTSYTGSPKSSATYGFILDFTASSSSPIVKSFKYVDGNLGGLGGIAAFDDKIAVMGLYSGELVRTTNGGASWDTVYAYNNPDTAFVDGVKRVPGTDTVYAFGDADSKGVFIGRSVNKGLTWTRLTVGPKGSKSSWYGYAGYDQCLATVPGKVWYTAYTSLATKDSLLISSSTDGGATWVESSIFLTPNVAVNYYFRSINFKDANVGYAVSRRSHLTLADNDNRYHRTTDGGKTWSDTISMEPTQLSKTHKVYSIKNIPGTDWVLGVGFSTLTGSKSWLSKDGGLTFEVIPTKGPSNLTNFLAKDSSRIIVGGFKQLLYKINNSQSDDVAFSVNMNTQKNILKFNPATDSVVVRGDFLPGNWWDSNIFKLADTDGDGIYSGTYPIVAPKMAKYKFVVIKGTNSFWETRADRFDTIPSTPMKLKTKYYDDDSTSVIFDNNITFQVNMSVQMKKSKFNKASDSVVVRGDFNGWGGKTNLLKDADGDSIYTGTYNIASMKKIIYKFVTISTSGDGWESSPDRIKDNMTGPTTILPVAWFNNDSVIVTIVPVVFRVNMRVKLAEGAFKPALGHRVFARGEMNGWSEADTLFDADNDSIFTKTLQMDQGKGYKYKFMMKAATDVWEGGNDKLYTVPVGGGSVPLGYFDNDSLVSVPTSGNIMYRVNMAVFEQTGWFSRAQGDSMQVNGGFNSWGGTNLIRKAGTETYELTRAYTGFTYDQEDFKFFMKFNPTTVVTRFPKYNNDTKWDYSYEHPAERGDGNRVFNYKTGGNIQTPHYFISDIDPRGIVKAGDTVTVTFSVDMTPALTHSIPFNPALDTVSIMFFDAVWKATSKVQDRLKLVKIGSTYKGSVNVVGPTHFNMLYQINYGTVTEGGGLGVQNPFRTRFIKPISANTFPRNYSTPVDVWKKDSPLPGEPSPYPMGVIEQTINLIPDTYSLSQNYPNPFNPSTKIRYAVPQESIVKLRIYNVLGQVVATVVDQKQVAGEYVVSFDASHLGTGAYLYSLEAGTFKSVKKMLLVK